ncbi:glycosyltransferase [Luteimicrobium sp. NPDC057192]|uniref:glycosyltransferase n=1 Tax=Luteimicrobium sp. NPDC057192 TaxID=3346042 RepID=UPI003642EA0A
MPRFRKLRRIAAQRLPIATKDQVRAVEARTTAWREAYERLLAAAENRAVGKTPGRLPKPDPATRVRRAAEQRAGSQFLTSVQHGGSLAGVSVRTVREMIAAKKLTEARALAASFTDRPETREVGLLLTGVVASRQAHHELALGSFDGVDAALVREHAAGDYFRSLFVVDADRGLAEASAVAGEPSAWGARTWFELVKLAFGHRDGALAQRLFDRMVEADRANPGVWKTAATEIAWLEKWIGAERRRSTGPAPEGRVSFGLIDYVQPGRQTASQNIGDQIQTLASLGHVVRHQNLRFHGQPDVVDFVERMQQRVRPELALDSVAADVDLHTVARDASTYQEFPEDTWLLEFGWHMHGLFGLEEYDFPMHPNLRPIFVSFHCRKRNMMTPEAIEYLRAHGPIGCRDWTTVDLLLSLDVPAFFSGCLTTTVNTVFPDLPSKPAPATVYVDVQRSTVPAGHENVRQSYGEVKKRTFAENMQDAVDLLERYRQNYTDVVTLRLHCYLPTTSLGMKVRFEPGNNADARFNGLFRLDAAEFEAIRTPMRDRLQPVLEAIFAGKSSEDVYALWREITEPDVRIARERHARPAPTDAGAEALAARALGLAPAKPADGPVDVVMTPTPGELDHARTVLASAAAATTRPVRAWLVGRLDPDALQVPGVEVHVVDTRSLDAAEAGVTNERALDRALIAQLVPVDRAVVLPVDALVVGDLAELVDVDLEDTLLAARTTSSADTSGFSVMYAAARRFDDAPDTAYELYRQIHGRHVFDFDAFDTGVLVADLAGMRAAGTAADALTVMRAFRLNDREALVWVFGPHRTVLDERWAYVPTRDSAREPAVWHWADATKPWSKDYAAGRALWLEAARAHA